MTFHNNQTWTENLHAAFQLKRKLWFSKLHGSNYWQALQAQRKHLLTFLRKEFACVTEPPSVRRQITNVNGTLSLDLTVR